MVFWKSCSSLSLPTLYIRQSVCLDVCFVRLHWLSIGAGVGFDIDTSVVMKKKTGWSNMWLTLSIVLWLHMYTLYMQEESSGTSLSECKQWNRWWFLLFLFLEAILSRVGLKQCYSKLYQCYTNAIPPLLLYIESSLGMNFNKVVQIIELAQTLTNNYYSALKQRRLCDNILFITSRYPLFVVIIALQYMEFSPFFKNIVFGEVW